MQSREIVKRAIEFNSPPRLPFFQHEFKDVPDDVHDIWEMDRAQAGWFFDNAGMDDWGCLWEITDVKNMGQVVKHPLADWSSFANYQPPNPLNPYYYERVEPLLKEANGRYVVCTNHFTLLERFHMLRGFAPAMEDLYLEPEKTHALLDMILDVKLRQFQELHRRFGNAIDGIFMTEDWGTQQGTFIGLPKFEEFFAPRYKQLFDLIHDCGLHVILHSCGKINAFVPRFIELGVDVLNMQQPRAYGLVEFGDEFRGKVCFLTTADIQATLPRGSEEEVREEVRLLVEHWGTPKGGLVVFNYGDPEALAVPPAMSRVMFEEFVKHMHLG